MGVRDIRVAVDMQGIHRNSERPAYFQAWIAVPDLYLPTKGTAYRANRHDDQQVKPGEVSEICTGELWRLQGLPFDMLPGAVAEGDFKVPSAKAHLCAHDGRKNLTDLQETAQWLAGEAVTTSLLKALLGVSGLLSSMLFLYFVLVGVVFTYHHDHDVEVIGKSCIESSMCPKVLMLDLGENLKKAADIHTTPYCASVEKACLNLRVPILSVTENPVNHSFTLLSVSQGLLEETIFGKNFLKGKSSLGI